MSIQAAALIIGLPLFLWGCEKDLAGRGSGKRVTINFAVSNEGYGADREILTGAGAKDLEGETVYIPLNDNYFMAATLRAEPAEETAFDGSQLRAAAAFEPGQKIYFAVYAISGTSPLDEAVYEWNGSKFVPDGEPLGVDADGTNYHFVAYSFFGDPTEEPYESDIEPWQDLVWGEATKSIDDTEVSRTVSIVMKHKFSRVQVKVDASTITGAKVIDIDNVVIGGGEEADLTVKTGVVAPTGAAATETLENWTSEDAGKAMLSEAKVFYPSLTTISIGTLDLEIDDDPVGLTNKSVTFSQALAENTNYTVVVDVRSTRWAYSNIYWVSTGSNTGYLTFDTSNNGNQGYQGVFFKWGSLVGVSPAQTGGNDAFSSSTPVYIPSYHSWDPLTSTWSSPTTSNYTASAWYETINMTENDHTQNVDPATIPYLDGRKAFNSAIPFYPEYNTDEMYGNLRGDICQYLGKTQSALGGYRLPTHSEITQLPSVALHGTFAGDNSVGNAEGTMDLIKAGFTYLTSPNVVLPAAGSRVSNGILQSVGAAGGYLSGDPWANSGWYAGGCGFGSSGYSSFRYMPRSRAHSARCIKKLPTE
jgi:hypothetical protein